MLVFVNITETLVFTFTPCLQSTNSLQVCARLLEFYGDGNFQYRRNLLSQQ